MTPKDFLISIWQNRSAIIQGMRNFLFAKGKVREIAAKRREFCKICPFASHNAKRLAAYKSCIPFRHCTLCGCSLLIKPYSLESECPKKIWQAEKIG